MNGIKFQVRVTRLGDTFMVSLHEVTRKGKGKRLYKTEVRNGESYGDAVTRALDEYSARIAKESGE